MARGCRADAIHAAIEEERGCKPERARTVDRFRTDERGGDKMRSRRGCWLCGERTRRLEDAVTVPIFFECHSTGPSRIEHDARSASSRGGGANRRMDEGA